MIGLPWLEPNGRLEVVAKHVEAFMLAGAKKPPVRGRPKEAISWADLAGDTGGPKVTFGRPSCRACGTYSRVTSA